MDRNLNFSDKLFDLIDQLSDMDVKLFLEEDQLRYSAPKGVLNDELLNRLKVAKQDLIRFLKLQNRAAKELEDEIPANPNRASFPLTFAQQRFWFLDQLAGGNSSIYNMLPIVLQIEGPLQKEPLESALAILVERHKVLSNRFSIEGDEPRQWPGQPGKVPVTWYDLSDENFQGIYNLDNPDDEVHTVHSETDNQISGDRNSEDGNAFKKRVSHIILDEGERAFDLTEGGPLIRLGLIKLAPQRHILILTLHHIVADGWSLGNLISEFTQLYQAAEAKRPIELQPMSIQYGDFALWERQRLDRLLLQRYLHFWKRELNGAPRLLELPTDRPRPRLQSYNGRTHAFILDKALTSQIQQFANRQGATPFMVLLTLFGMLLGRYARQDELIIGSPLSVRKHSQCEPLVGLFLNTIPLRIDLKGNPGFTELLDRVKKRSLAAYENGEVPFDELLQALDIGRALNHTPLFQVLFALQNAPVGKMDRVELQNGSLSITPIEPENSKAPFDLVLSMEEVPEGIRGRFRYNSDLFDPMTITRMAGHFRRLLVSALKDSDRPVKQLPMMTESELDQMKHSRGGLNEYPVHSTLHELIEKVAKDRPEADAVSFDGTEWSYGKLNQKANVIARYLINTGVKSGHRVGVCMTRSADLIASLLAILKTGAAYVPLDAAYPAERLEYMVSDANIDVVITDHEVADSVPNSVNHIVNIADINQNEEGIVHAFEPGIEESEAIDQEVNVDPSSVAYIIYTSGSTGHPKGVEVTHANVIRLFSSTESLFGFSESDIWTLFHSYAFDFSVWEIFGALLYGGKLVVVPFWVSRSPDAFFDLLQTEKVTVLNQTPSAFRQLVEIDRRDGGRETSLKWVVFGGEALELKSLEGWCDRHGFDQPQLINMYGITETTVHVTFHRLTENDLKRGISIIGRPLPDLTVDLLDESGNVVPVGVPGEIVVGGGGVARGYLNRPELTAERFVDGDSVDYQVQNEGDGATIHNDIITGDKKQKPAKFYKSGDLARRLPDGTLEYLGRIDQQVKIRGFRIELGEIEAGLASYPGIASAVVTVRTGESGNELAGYVVFQTGVDGAGQILAIREHIGKKLPEYMIPASLVVLDEMPLTTNGKIDRKALPEPGRELRTSATEYIAPTTDLERILAGLWEDVLHVEKVGILDNFFELGGDSIKGAIFANRLQQKIDAVFYVVALFEAPTISELIDYMRIHYPDTVSAFGDASDVAVSKYQLTTSDLTSLQKAIEPLAPFPEILKSPKNRRAIFVLAPPRSGTTLLRVLLSGHSTLFAPPELELMPFNTLTDRSETYTGGDSFWLEGTLRAVMELKNCDADSAKALMAEREAAEMSVKDFYAEMQTWLGERILVDKSPSYVLDPLILERIEATFEDPLYIHLHRHPCGMIRSFEEARLQQIFFRYPHNYSPKELAELIWVHSHRNITAFLETIPDHRKLQISFEEMTRAAEDEVKRMCKFIGIGFESKMLDIHGEREKKRRMTDGIHKESKMLGDVKFHTHKKINPATADRWRKSCSEEFLSDIARETALELGYKGAHVALKTGTISLSLSGKLEAQSEKETGERIHQEVVNGTDSKKSKNGKTVPRHSEQSLIAKDLAQRPLSFSQQRLWFLEQLEGSGNTYNMPVALWLNGPLDTEALKKAVMAIPSRHEVLRSRFITENGEPVCLLEESLPPPPIVDLQLLNPEQREEEALKWLEIESNRGFDLAKGPLYRASIIRLTPNRHLLTITMHHIVSDGWSLGIVSNELEQFYKVFSNSEDFNDPKNTPDLKSPRVSAHEPLVRQYCDYAIWQRELLTSGELDRQLMYWKNQLKDSPALLELPSDRPRTAIKKYSGETTQFRIDADLLKKVKRLAESSGSTLYMTLLTVFGILLNRYSGQSVIPVGSPVANRRDSNFEPLIGFFVNTLVMKMSINPEQTFRELLKQVRNVALEAYANQDVSFEQIVDEIQPERNMGYTPLFQVMMTMQTGNLSLPDLSGIRSEVADYSNTVSKYDLTLLFAEENYGLTGYLEYSTDLFDEWRIKQIGENFNELLKWIVKEEEKPVKKLPLLAAGTRKRVLQEWNQTDVDLTGPMTVHEVISHIAGQNPKRTAISCGEDKLSYGELESRSNRLAHLLLSRGLKEKSRVAVALERSLDMVVTLLAILKTGCTYVPLDPSYPANRIEMIFEDAKIDWLMTHSKLVEVMPACNHVVLINEVMEGTELDEFPDSVPVSNATGEDLAYVIFTSGSTGRPKGVMIHHMAVVNMLRSVIEQPGISMNDIVLAVTTIAFDISVVELWGALFAGAQIVIATADDARDGEALLDLIQRREVTLVQVTPATWNLLIESGWEGTPGLKCICGGEAMPRQLADELLIRCGELWNMYGPTETTVWSSIYKIDKDRDHHDSIEPIGRPIANTTLYILDEALNPVPPGVPGELFIGGAGVAAGYLNRSDLTDERFVPDPFGSNGRIYRTGDLARFRHDGVIEYIGRIDQQVKLRGFRIEPGEIEHQLKQYSGIQQCAVTLQGDGVDARLVAFYIPEQEGVSISPGELKSFLLTHLPDYMVPSLFFAIENMPLTPNGKLDRNALKTMAGSMEIRSEAPKMSARDITELRLLKLWQELLGDSSIGPEDNFFDAGGHSLIAVRLMSGIGADFGRQLPLAALFQSPTVAQLARQIKLEGSANLWSPLVEMRSGRPEYPPLYCAPGAGGNILYLQPLSKYIKNEIPFWGLQPPGLDGLTTPAVTVEELASRYIEAIQSHNPDGPYHLSGHSFGGIVAYEMARQLKMDGHEIGKLIILDSPAPQWITPTGLDWAHEEWLVQVSQIASHQYGVDLNVNTDILSGLNVDDQLALLQQRLIDTGVFPVDADINHLKGFMEVYRTNLQMDYKPKESKLDVDLLLIRSADLQPDEIADEKAKEIRSNEDLGWSQWIGGVIEIIEVPGDHLTMLNPPHVEKLANVINSELSEIDRITHLHS